MKTQLFSHYVATGVWLLLKISFKSQSKDIFAQINDILKGKFTQKESWSEMKKPTKTRRTPLTVCKYLV